MPWDVKKQGSKWVVYKESTGKVVGTHPTRAAAVRQMRALYASEGKKDDKG